MNDFAEVIYHWQKGQNKTQIATSLGISRPTVRKYLKVAQAAGLTENADTATLARVLEEIAKAAKPVSQWPSAVLKNLTLHDEAIRSWLGEPDMTAKQIRRLLAEQGDVFSYSSVKRYVRKLKPGARPVTVRLETAPGEQVQVDFGQVMLQLPDTRKKVWAFVMTLSYSRHRFVRFVERQDTNTWLDCHIRAFEFFGGCPRTVLLDNLKRVPAGTRIHKGKEKVVMKPLPILEKIKKLLAVALDVQIRWTRNSSIYAIPMVAPSFGG
jgi:transposase